MTDLEWVLKHPEWVSLLATSLFAIITICIICWQAIVSTRAQRRQNNLLQYQLEYARMQSLNVVRGEVLALLSKLRTCLGLVKQSSDEGWWNDMQDAFYDLYDKTSTLDSSMHRGYYDGWYASLDGYMDDMFEAVVNDSRSEGRTERGKCPTGTTVKAFDAAESKWNPSNIALEIKTAIRMTASVFHEKWSDLLPFD